MSANVFKRYELKYLLSDDQYRNILEKASPYLEADSHGKSTIQSLYFDTDNYLLIRRSIEKPLYKEKLRLRSYGLARPDTWIYLELKKKFAGVVYKRRVQMKMKEYPDVPSTQIGKEIHCFKDRYKDLQEKFLLIYEREAYSQGELRLTFDHDIRYRNSTLDLSSNLDGIPILEGNKVLLEIKTGLAIPLWLVKLLDDQKAYKTSFSKVGEAYKISQFQTARR